MIPGMKDVINKLDADIEKTPPPMILVSPDLMDALQELERVTGAKNGFPKLDGKIPVELGDLEDDENYILRWPNRKITR